MSNVRSERRRYDRVLYVVRIVEALKRGPHTSGQLRDQLARTPHSLSGAIHRACQEGLIEKIDGCWCLTK